MDRRIFLKRMGMAVVSAGATGAAVYPFLEAKWLRVVRRTITVLNLPQPFQGVTIALLADLHHGPFVPLAYIRHVVTVTNGLNPTSSPSPATTYTSTFSTSRRLWKTGQAESWTGTICRSG